MGGPRARGSPRGGPGGEAPGWRPTGPSANSPTSTSLWACFLICEKEGVSWGSNIHVGGGDKGLCLLETMQMWDTEGKVWASWEPCPSPHPTNQVPRGAGAALLVGRRPQHRVDLREVQVYRFMSNIISQALSAKGRVRTGEKGLQALQGGLKWPKGAGGLALPPLTRPAAAPSPQPASRRAWAPLGTLGSASAPPPRPASPPLAEHEHVWLACPAFQAPGVG